MPTDSQSETIRVLHVDQQTLLRDLFAMAVQATPGIELTGSTGDTAEALKLVKDTSPDVVLLEARLTTGQMTAMELATKLCQDHPDVKVIALSGQLYPAYIHELNSAGVKGYLLKSESWHEILRAIRAIQNGAFVASPDVAQTLLSGRDAFKRNNVVLNIAETKLMNLVAEGMSNNDIALSLHVSESTVRSRVGRVLTKLGATSRTQAVTESIRRGFVVVE